MKDSTLNFNVPWGGNSHVILAHRYDSPLFRINELAELILPFSAADYQTAQIAEHGESKFIQRRSFFVMRYLSVNWVYENVESDYGVELGSGFSPRGMEAVSEGRRYFETDLPPIVAAKRPAVTALLGEGHTLSLDALDATDAKALALYVHDLPSGRPCFIIEALFPHIPHDTHDSILLTLRDAILKRGGGTILLTDIYLKGLAQKIEKSFRGFRNLGKEAACAAIADLPPKVETWDRDGRFEDFVSACAHFKRLGFAVRAAGIDHPERELSVNSLLNKEPIELNSDYILYTLTPV